jgi:hypothetical protein
LLSRKAGKTGKRITRYKAKGKRQKDKGKRIKEKLAIGLLGYQVWVVLIIGFKPLASSVRNNSPEWSITS